MNEICLLSVDHVHSAISFQYINLVEAENGTKNGLMTVMQKNQK